MGMYKDNQVILKSTPLDEIKKVLISEGYEIVGSIDQFKKVGRKKDYSYEVNLIKEDELMKLWLSFDCTFIHDEVQGKNTLFEIKESPSHDDNVTLIIAMLEKFGGWMYWADGIEIDTLMGLHDIYGHAVEYKEDLELPLHKEFILRSGYFVNYYLSFVANNICPCTFRELSMITIDGEKCRISKLIETAQEHYKNHLAKIFFDDSYKNIQTKEDDLSIEEEKYGYTITKLEKDHNNSVTKKLTTYVNTLANTCRVVELKYTYEYDSDNRIVLFKDESKNKTKKYIYDNNGIKICTNEYCLGSVETEVDDKFRFTMIKDNDGIEYIKYYETDEYMRVVTTTYVTFNGETKRQTTSIILPPNRYTTTEK